MCSEQLNPGKPGTLEEGQRKRVCNQDIYPGALDLTQDGLSVLGKDTRGCRAWSFSGC